MRAPTLGSTVVSRKRRGTGSLFREHGTILGQMVCLSRLSGLYFAHPYDLSVKTWLQTLYVHLDFQQ